MITPRSGTVRAQARPVAQNRAFAGEAILAEIGAAGASDAAQACKHQSSSRADGSLAVAIGQEHAPEPDVPDDSYGRRAVIAPRTPNVRCVADAICQLGLPPDEKSKS